MPSRRGRERRGPAKQAKDVEKAKGNGAQRAQVVLTSFSDTNAHSLVELLPSSQRRDRKEIYQAIEASLRTKLAEPEVLPRLFRQYVESATADSVVINANHEIAMSLAVFTVCDVARPALDMFLDLTFDLDFLGATPGVLALATEYTEDWESVFRLVERSSRQQRYSINPLLIAVLIGCIPLVAFNADIIHRTLHILRNLDSTEYDTFRLIFGTMWEMRCYAQAEGFSVARFDVVWDADVTEFHEELLDKVPSVAKRQRAQQTRSLRDLSEAIQKIPCNEVIQLPGGRISFPTESYEQLARFQYLNSLFIGGVLIDYLEVFDAVGKFFGCPYRASEIYAAGGRLTKQEREQRAYQRDVSKTSRQFDRKADRRTKHGANQSEETDADADLV